MEINKNYRIINHKVQLVRSSVDSMSIEKTCDGRDLRDLVETQEFRQESTVSHAVLNELFDGSVKGLVKAKFVITADGKPVVTANIALTGTFRNISEEVDENKFKEMVAKLCVPLLFPHIRSVVIILCSTADIPSFNVPTVDVLKSITENEKIDSEQP